MVAVSPVPISFHQGSLRSGECQRSKSAMSILSNVVSGNSQRTRNPFFFSSHSLIIVFSQDNLYENLFILADLHSTASTTSDVQLEAFKLLQLLPTHLSIPAGIREALVNDGTAVLSDVKALLLGHSDQVLQPAKLLYNLQVRRASFFFNCEETHSN